MGTDWGKAAAVVLVAAVLGGIAVLMFGRPSADEEPRRQAESKGISALPVAPPASSVPPAAAGKPGASVAVNVRSGSAAADPAVLAAFRQGVRSPDSKIRMSIATSSKAPPDVLAQLAADGDANVRRRVADNRESPPEILARLASDSDDDVRLEVARNPRTPVKALQNLASDKAPDVSQEAAAALAKRGVAPAKAD
jgi:hypothetical protein